jgi:hypothetical protein
MTSVERDVLVCFIETQRNCGGGTYVTALGQDGEPTDAELLAALSKTGFLLEQQVAQFFLQQDGFEAAINFPFTDPDSGKSREIDVLAWWADYSGDAGLGAPFVSATFLVECKNTSNPYVVVGSADPYPTYYLRHRNTYVPEFDPLALGWQEVQSTFDYLDLKAVQPQPFEGGFVGHQLVRLDRSQKQWRADNSGVHDSIVYPLAKAGNAHARRIPDRPEIGQNASFGFYFPVLITSGPLYTVLVDKASSQVRRVHWAPLVRRFADKHLQGEHLFEIVEFSHLGEYFEDRAMKYVRRVIQRFSDNIHVFNPTWLQNEFGEPTNREGLDAWRAAIERDEPH